MQLTNILLVSLLFGQSFAETDFSLSDRSGSCMNTIDSGVHNFAHTMNSGYKNFRNLVDTSIQTLKSLTEPTFDAVTSGFAELWKEVMTYFNKFEEQFDKSLNKLKVFADSFPKNSVAANNVIKSIINIIENYHRLIQESLNRIDIRYNEEISKFNTTLTADVEHINFRLAEISRKNEGSPMIAKLVTSTNNKLRECVPNILAPIQKFYNNTVQLVSPGLTQVESVVNEIVECKDFPLEQALRCVDVAKTKLPISEDTEQTVKSMERRIFNTNWKDIFDDSCLVSIKMEIDYLINGNAQQISKFIDSKTINNLGEAAKTNKFTTSMSENSNPAPSNNIASIQTNYTISTSPDNIKPIIAGEIPYINGSTSSTPEFNEPTTTDNIASTSTNEAPATSPDNIEPSPINLGEVSNINGSTLSSPEFTEPTPTTNIATIPTNEVQVTSLYNIEPSPINFGEISNINGSTSSTSEFAEPIPTDKIASMSTNEIPAMSSDNVEPTPINLGESSNINVPTTSTPDFTETTPTDNTTSMPTNETPATSSDTVEPTPTNLGKVSNISGSTSAAPEFIELTPTDIESSDNVKSVPPVVNKIESKSATKRRELNMHPELSRSILKIINNISTKVRGYLTQAFELYNGLRKKISSSRRQETENELKFLEKTFKEAIEPVSDYDEKLKAAAVELNNCNTFHPVDEFMKCVFKIVCNANINDEGEQILTALIDKLNSITVN